MTAMTVRQQKRALRVEAAAWQRAAVGLLALSTLANAALAARIRTLEDRRAADADQYRARIEQADHTRDLAVRELGAMSLQAAQDRETRAAQAAAYEAVGDYRYVGECTLTWYCPCGECCGRWSDGLTATGLPASPGAVAVDPEVIPLGSTVIIDGQTYLAADTGVKGLAVDIFVTDHAEAERLGVGTAEVWCVDE